jgi:hypothetical protein
VDALKALPDSDPDKPHFPSGDLHDLPPTEDDDLPPEDQPSGPTTITPAGANFVEPDPEDLAHPYNPKGVFQPVAISLNEA